MDFIMNIITIVLTGATTYIVWLLQNMKNKKDFQSEALKLLMKKELRELHKEYKERGHITADELDNVEQLYKAYHGLGGNGTGTKMYEEIKKLDIKED